MLRRQSALVTPGALWPIVAIVLLGLFVGKFVTVSPGSLPILALAAVVMFFLAFFKPSIALVVMVFAMLLSPEAVIGSVPKHDIVIRIEDFLIVVMGAAWIARGAVSKGFDVIPRTPVNMWIGFYCVCIVVSTSQGIITSGVNPLKASFYILKELEYYILFFIVVGSTYKASHYRMYLTAFFLTFMAVNLFAFSQIGHVQRVSAPFEGPRGEPNTLGAYLLLMMCIALGLFCHLRSRILRWAVLFSMIAGLLPFLYTLSRSSYLAIVPAYLALIFYSRSSRRGYLVMGFLAAVALGLLFLPEHVKDRLLYTFLARPQANIKPVEFLGLKLDPSASSRWWDWVAAVQYWIKQPFFGYGVTAKAFMDSQYLNNLVEKGAVGFLSFAFLIGGLQRNALRIYRTGRDELTRGLALGFLAGNIGMLVHAMTANTFILIRVMEPYWFLSALVLSAPRVLEAKPAAAPARGNALPQEKDSRRESGEEKTFWRRNISYLLRNGPGSPKGGTDAT
ncbi:MAG: O-antigen ligase family protein [Candidatus Omnitrophica bacterium]|nr:O-antigen ligase family protein [Candidatus Omnitrophota bacterium]